MDDLLEEHPIIVVLVAVVINTMAIIFLP